MNPEDIVNNLLVSVKEELDKNDKQVSQELEDQFTKEVLDVINVGKEALEDKKISFNEAVQIVINVAEVLELTALLKETYPDEKELVKKVCAITKDIYYSEDGFNDPDISFIPNFIEGWVEKAIFKLVLPHVLEYILTKEKSNDE